MTDTRKPISGVVLLRKPDGAALLQHRDDKPGLPHADLWVPPGGHCEDGESPPACAGREFHEETGYRCANLRFLKAIDVDGVPFSPPLRVTMFWDVYDGRQTLVRGEGQALEFVPRDLPPGVTVPTYCIELWDEALSNWRTLLRRGRLAQ